MDIGIKRHDLNSFQYRKYLLNSKHELELAYHFLNNFSHDGNEEFIKELIEEMDNLKKIISQIDERIDDI